MNKIDHILINVYEYDISCNQNDSTHAQLHRSLEAKTGR